MKDSKSGFVLLMSLLSVLGLLGTDICAPCLPVIAEALHVTQSASQWLISAFLLGIALSQLLAGPLSDHYGRRPVALVGVCTLASALISVVSGLTLMCALRFVQALGAGAGITLARAVVADRFKATEMAMVLAIISPIAGASPALAPLLGTHLTTWFGWRSTFGFMALAACFVWILAARTLQESLAIERRVPLQLKALRRSHASLLTNRTFVGYCVMTCAVDSAYFSYVSQAPFLLDAAGASAGFIGGCFSAVAVTYIVSNLLAARLMQRFSLGRIVDVGVFFVVAGALGMFALTTLLPFHGLWLVLPMMVISLGNGFVLPLGTASAVAACRDHAGAAAGAIGFSQLACAGVATAVGSQLCAGQPARLAGFMLASLSIAACANLGLKLRPGPAQKAAAGGGAVA